MLRAIENRPRLRPTIFLLQGGRLIKGSFHSLLLSHRLRATLGLALFQRPSASKSQPDEAHCRRNERRRRRVAPTPAPQSPSPARGPSLDRPAFEEATEIVGQRLCAGVAPLRLLV